MALAENRGGAVLEAAWHKILISKPVNKPNTLDAKGLQVLVFILLTHRKLPLLFSFTH